MKSRHSTDCNRFNGSNSSSRSDATAAPYQVSPSYSCPKHLPSRPHPAHVHIIADDGKISHSQSVNVHMVDPDADNQHILLSKHFDADRLKDIIRGFTSTLTISDDITFLFD